VYSLNFEKLVPYDAGKPGITIEVEIRMDSMSANFQAKIDTGAEACIFERIYGERLGIEIESGERQYFSSVTGDFLTYGHSVTLTVADFKFDSYVFFAADESFRKNVLGRFGLLNRLIIGINDYDGKLYLSSYDGE
jgi:hypothetical protein